MKITDINITGYEWNRPKPLRNGKYIYPKGGIAVITIDTDSGVYGLGITGGVTIIPFGIIKAFVDEFKPILIGENPFDVEKIWAQLWAPKVVGRRGLSTKIISLIDIALWDIRGKATNQPLHKLLGGYQESIPVYLAGGYYEEGKTLSDLSSEMSSYVELGVTSVKMKIGGASIAQDIERVRIARDAIGPDVNLMVDANNAYTYSEAIRIAKRLEEFDIFWFEEPVAPDDYRGHKLVADATSIPIAAGENEFTRYGFRDLIEGQCVAILNPDAQVLGGITEFMKVAALAQAYNLPISPHGLQELHIHLATAIPNGMILEYYNSTTDPMWGKCFKQHLVLEEGYAIPSSDPGLGIEIDTQGLKPYKIL
tara:strand:+ start:3652 stop:4752 length:1101 start_codon:yes stop_codon:yes gene_type:complete